MTAQIVPSISMTSYFLYGILIYLAAINVAAFFLYGIDNKAAAYRRMFEQIGLL